nr:sugar ABC transporter permease [Clostridia bacterium]
MTGNALISSARRRPLAARFRLALVRHWEAYLLFLPVAVWYILFCYVPMGGMVIAFKKFSVIKGIWDSPWVGMQNFHQLLKMPSFSRAIRNTLIISLQRLFFQFPMPILFALMLNELPWRRFKKSVQTVSYLPHFISWSVAGGLVYMLLSPNTGAINNLAVALGGTAQNYIGLSGYFRAIVLASGIWKSLGWSAIVYLAAISAVDEQLYEAAYI